MKTVIANWKSHKTISDMQTWLNAFVPKYQALKNSDLEVIIAPPMSGVAVANYFLAQAKVSGLALGIQDLSPFPAGSYTGAISTQNLEGLAVKYALVGHSERRRYFHETHQEIANKVEEALQAGIIPVVCVDQDYVTAQMSAIPENKWAKCVVAYEPVAAIGSGNQEPIAKVTPIVEKMRHDFHPAGVIYGGSVSASSVASYLEVCDGCLVATHSLEVADFISLLKAC